MKSMLVMLLTLCVACISLAQVSYTNTKAALYLAKDSSLVNGGTKLSQPVTVFSKTPKLSTGVNYLNGASVIVYGKQTNDSLHGLIYIRVGQITGGTPKVSYADVLVDSLTLTKNTALLDLTKYLYFPEVAIKIIGASAGNGIQATWSAQFGGAGKPIVLQ